MKTRTKNFRNKKILSLSLFAVLLAVTVVVSAFSSKYTADTRVRADDLSPWCDAPHDCCKKLAQTGNPDACMWPERKYCTQTQCSTIPAGRDVKRCGLAYIEAYPYGCIGRPTGGFPGSPKTATADVTSVPVPSDYFSPTPISGVSPVPSVFVFPTIVPSPTGVTGPIFISITISPTDKLLLPTAISPTVSKERGKETPKFGLILVSLKDAIMKFILTYLP